jgi:hypothetical protein
MSELKVNKVTPRSGTTVTLGDSGDTITIPSGATIDLSSATQTGVGGANTPAFQATINSSQSITSAVNTKAQFAVEDFDTDSCYDNTTNYRFTPTVAGKYFVYSQINATSGVGAIVIQEVNSQIKKNGTIVNVSGAGEYTNNFTNFQSSHNYCIIDFNGTTDYVEVFVEIYLSSGTVTLSGGSPAGSRCFFGAYKLIGV